jgi:hypothetical protein
MSAARPLWLDFVAKRFWLLERAGLIQNQAPMRKVDSDIHVLSFDCFKFLFHSSAAATFATKSLVSGRGRVSS